MFLYYFDVIKSVKLAELGDAKKEKMTAIGERGSEFCGCDWLHPKHDLMAVIDWFLLQCGNG